MKSVTRLFQTSMFVLAAGVLLAGCSSTPSAPSTQEPTLPDISVVSKALSDAVPEGSTVDASATGPSHDVELVAMVTVPQSAVVGAETVRAAVEAVCATAPGDYSLFTPTFVRGGVDSTILEPEDAIDTEGLLAEAYGTYAETGVVSASGSVIMEKACA